MDVVKNILRLILARRYQFTDHALDALDEHRLSLADVLFCLSTGVCRRSWPRQRKYEVEGRSIDGRRIRVIIRLLAGRVARIITLYEVTPQTS